MKKNPELLSIKQLIHQVIPGKKEILFFGSRITGTYKKDSDYDLLVIVYQKDVSRKRLMRFQAQIKRLCARLGLDVDVIVRDKIHSEEMKNFPGNIIHSAFQTGINI